MSEFDECAAADGTAAVACGADVLYWTVWPSKQVFRSMRELLLLAGLLCDDTPLVDVARRLSSVANVRIVSFANLRSIGEMAELVERVGPARFALAGHSMGGRVALEVWRRAPARITGLGLMNTGAGACRPDESAARSRFVELARAQGMTALAASWLPPMMGTTSARRQRIVDRLTQMIERASLESFAGQQSALLNRPDAEPVLPTITVPTMLLSATNDTWSPIAQHVEMQRAIPGSTLVTIEDAGHMAPIEQPETVARALAEWLART